MEPTQGFLAAVGSGLLLCALILACVWLGRP